MGAPSPQGVSNSSTSYPSRTHISHHRWLNWPNRDASTLAPEFKQLVSAASQQPVPEEGKRIGLPVVVLNTGFKAFRQVRVSSGKIGDRWSSIATFMARRMRSGTLVGPGTKRKLRPGIESPLIRMSCLNFGKRLALNGPGSQHVAPRQRSRG